MPVGNLGNISALYKGFKLMKDLDIISRMPRLVAAQSARANPFYQSFRNGFKAKVSIPAQSTLASAIQIGNPVSYDKAVQAIQETDGIVGEASEHELANAGALADRTGMYTCPHTAVALAVLFKLLQKGTIQSEEKVVVISTAHGLKFTRTKLGYHQDTLDEVESEHANQLLNLPADADVVKAAVERELDAYA